MQNMLDRGMRIHLVINDSNYYGFLDKRYKKLLLTIQETVLLTIILFPLVQSDNIRDSIIDNYLIS